MEFLLEFMGKGIIMMLSIALPCVLTAAAIGLVVGILQAVTQVQEQTIAAAPKITAVFLVILILGSGFVRMLSNLFTEAVHLSFNVIPKNEKYVLDADYFLYTSPFDKEMGMKGHYAKDLIDQPGNPPFIDNNEKMKYYAAPKMPVPTPNQIERNKIYQQNGR
ncbi:MAG: flagellar biosynthetic protein FliQ [Candidatus Gastranaerophilales bacterium]|nr:flagellar biosynthetic protein FliQ [Candidatus Gastranaerophilales bacterium]